MPDFLATARVAPVLPPARVRELLDSVLGNHPDMVSTPHRAPLRVGLLIRPSVEAYVRVFHPLPTGEDGRDVGLLTWASLSDGSAPGSNQSLDDWLEANRGRLAKRQLEIAPQIGSLDHSTAVAIAREIEAERALVCYFFWQELPIPTSVYEGSLTEIGEFMVPGTPIYVNPTAWWGKSTDWYVVTHQEADSTYVGGSRRLIDRLSSVTDLETAEVDQNAAVWGSKIDTIFRTR